MASSRTPPVRRIIVPLILASLVASGLVAPPSHAGLGVAPDLVVASLSSTPASPGERDTVTLSATVTNVGTDLARDFDVRFFLDGVQLADDVQVLLLRPGESRTVQSASWVGVAGPHVARAVADAGSSVAESDDSNNARDLGLTVQARADLVVTSVTPSDADVREGELVTFLVGLENRGSAMTNATIDVTVGGQAIDRAHAIALGAGEARIVETPGWTAELGTLLVRATADAEAQEIDPTDNAAESSILVREQPRPDTTIVSLILDPPAPLPGDLVTFRAVVKNVGEETAIDALASLDLDGARLGEALLPSLQPQEEFEIMGDPWIATLGTHAVTARANSSHARDDASEANAVLSLPFDVSPPPPPPPADLVIEGIAIEPTDLAAGASTSLLATVRNTGGQASGPFRVAFDVDGSRLGEEPASSLGPGESREVSMGWNATEGDHEFSVVTDSGDEVPESGESNNEASRTIEVGPRTTPVLPDLIIAGIDVSPDQPGTGEDATFVATVVNHGEAISGTFAVRFAVDGQPLGDAQVVLLQAGDEVSVASPTWDGPRGVHTVTATADPAQSTAESSESNNAASVTFPVGPQATVTSPDLVVLSASLDPPYPAEGELVTFRATVANTGVDPASPFLVRFAVDDATVSDVPVVLLLPGESTTIQSQPWVTIGGFHDLRMNADVHDTVLEKDETNNRLDVEFYGRLPDLHVPSVGPADPATHGYDMTLAAQIENRDYNVNLGIPVGEDFEVFGAWTPSVVGGFTDFASAGYSTDRALSGTQSVTAGFSGGSSSHDYGQALMSRVLDLDRADRLSGRYLVSQYSHEGSFFDGMSAGVRITGIDAQGYTRAGPYEYWLSAWFRGEDTRAPSSNARLVEDKPPLETWLPFDVTPTQDFGASWPGVVALQVDLFVDAGGTVGDAYRIYFDDLELVGGSAGSAVVPGGAASSATSARVLLDGALLAERDVPPLQPGETVTVLAPPVIGAGGDHVANGEVDPNADVHEASEANNDRSTAFHVTWPNLNVASLATTPVIPLPSEQTTITVTVTNVGGRAAASTLRLTLDGATLTERSVPPLDSGATYDITIPWTATNSGDHTLVAKADALSVVTEELETDNVRDLLVHVAAPDVVLEAVSVSPESPAQGEIVQLSATVRNAGDAAAGAFVTRFAVDGMTVGESIVGGLAAGATVNVVGISWTSTGGIHSVSASADPSAALPEETRSNNHAEIGLFVRQPDLRVTSIVSGDPEHGDAATFEATIENRDYAVPVSILDDFEEPWTASSSGFSSFLSGATVGASMLRALSPTRSAVLGFSGGSCCTDQGQVNLVRTFPVTKVLQLQTKFYVDTYFHGGASGDVMRAHLRMERLGAQGQTLGTYDYMFSGWLFFGDGNPDPIVPTTKVLYGRPPLNQWVTLTADPTSDFGADWSGTSSVRVTLHVSASATRNSDSFRVFFDDLTMVVADAAPQEGSGSAPSPATISRFLVDGASVGDVAVPALLPGESATVTSGAWPAVGGDHTVRVVADALQAVPEFYENNAQETGFRVRQADLVVESLTQAPASPEQGDPVSFVARVKNVGDAPAAASTVRITLDGASELISQGISALAPGETVDVTAPTWTGVGGSHTVQATADVLSAVPELVESNNQRSATFGVRQPDLEVMSLTVSPTVIQEHDIVTLTATIKNSGAGTAPASTARFLVDGLGLIGEVAVPSIAPLASATVTAPAWSALPGDRSLSVLADATSAFPEGSEVNNARQLSIHARRAELTALSLVPSASSPTHGQATTFTAAVKNVDFNVPVVTEVLDDFESPSGWTVYESGASAWTSGASAGYSTLRSVSGTKSTYVLVNGGQPGSDFGSVGLRKDFTLGRIDEISLKFIVTQYSHDGSQWDGLRSGIRIIRLDPAGAQIGVNEYWLSCYELWSDTCPPFSYSKTIYGRPPMNTWLSFSGNPTTDFGIDWTGTAKVRIELYANAGGTFWTDNYRAEYDDLSVKSIVQGPGTATARDVSVRFLVDEVAIGDVTVPSLAPGATANVPSPSWPADGGDHVVRVVVDATSTWTEPDETDNERSIELHVRQAELDVGLPAIQPQPVDAGQAATFRASVSNTGDAPTSSFVVRFAVDDVTFADVAVSALAAGESTTVTSPVWTTAGGDHTLSVVVDVGGAVAEVDETDNAQSLPVHVRWADLLAISVVPADAPLHNGDRTTFTATARNGGDAATGSFIVRFVVDGTTIGESTVASLGPGEEAVVTSPTWRAEKGAHTVTAIVDAAATVNEASESNNALALDFGVEPSADLVVDAIAMGPNDPVRTGDATTFQATVSNVGERNAHEFLVSFFVDGVLLSQHTVTNVQQGTSVVVGSSSWPAAFGLHTVRVVVDPTDVVQEGIETNNERARDFPVL